MITQSVEREAALTTVRSYGYDYQDADSILAQIYDGAGKWWLVPAPATDHKAAHVRYNRCTKTYSFK